MIHQFSSFYVLNYLAFIEVFVFLYVQIDEEPVATSGTPTSIGSKLSTGSGVRSENHPPSIGTPQTPPSSGSPLTRCAVIYFKQAGLHFLSIFNKLLTQLYLIGY